MTAMINTNSEDLDDLLLLLQTETDKIKYNKFETMFPDDGPYRRELYVPQMRFMEATAHYRQLAFIGANRTGKTTVGAYIMVCHLTGLYPKWWKGRRFYNAVSAWAAGKTNKKTKEIIQAQILGPDGQFGTGMLPKHLIGNYTHKAGSGSGYVERLEVPHVSGGTSVLEFKSYEEERDGFEGTKQQVIWLDEEPKKEWIFSECAMRTTDKHNPGIIMCTFTPLYGLSAVAMKFVPDLIARPDGTVRDKPNRFAIQITWDDVPHLSQEEIENMWSECLPHERDARSKGIPSLGSGAIYPFTDDQIMCDMIEGGIPSWWPRCFGFDTGWEHNAAIWLAQDPDSGVTYIYDEYYAGRDHVAVHAYALKSRGDWITGAADAFAINQSDGSKMIDLYRDEGLSLKKAKKVDRESGIFKVSELFAAGLLKIIKAKCPNLCREIRTYGRDEFGKIIKKNDHACDAMRYGVTTAIEFMTTKDELINIDNAEQWGAGRDKYTGY